MQPLESVLRAPRRSLAFAPESTRSTSLSSARLMLRMLNGRLIQRRSCSFEPSALNASEDVAA